MFGLLMHRLHFSIACCWRSPGRGCSGWYTRHSLTPKNNDQKQKGSFGGWIC
nr:MAG TPA: Putative TetR-family transcriptional regulator [Caudoviricetes sp.]DAX06922.1 MAG TPA: Putative TetR-family transcriptional regulator [Bacteriophage sp.]